MYDTIHVKRRYGSITGLRDTALHWSLCSWPFSFGMHLIESVFFVVIALRYFHDAATIGIFTSGLRRK